MNEYFIDGDKLTSYNNIVPMKYVAGGLIVMQDAISKVIPVEDFILMYLYKQQENDITTLLLMDSGGIELCSQDTEFLYELLTEETNGKRFIQTRTADQAILLKTVGVI